MTDDLTWISIATRRPQDRQLVYARVKYGIRKKVTFYALPAPRWEGASIAYDFQYFAEWAVFSTEHKPPVRGR